MTNPLRYQRSRARHCFCSGFLVVRSALLAFWPHLDYFDRYFRTILVDRDDGSAVRKKLVESNRDVDRSSNGHAGIFESMKDLHPTDLLDGVCVCVHGVTHDRIFSARHGPVIGIAQVDPFLMFLVTPHSSSVFSHNKEQCREAYADYDTDKYILNRFH